MCNRAYMTRPKRWAYKASVAVNDLAQKAAYCLRRSDVIRLIGKEGRANLYEAV